MNTAKNVFQRHVVVIEHRLVLRDWGGLVAASCVEWMRVSRRHVWTSIAGRLSLGRSVPMKSQWVPTLVIIMIVWPPYHMLCSGFVARHLLSETLYYWVPLVAKPTCRAAEIEFSMALHWPAAHNDRGASHSRPLAGPLSTHCFHNDGTVRIWHGDSADDTLSASRVESEINVNYHSYEQQ